MAQKYFAYLTTRGEAKLAQATALGIQLKLTQMGVGDGGGTLPTPSPSQTRLINEKRRAGLNSLTVDAQNPGQLIAEQIIPENEGGWWIREIGLYDDTDELIAVANCAETYKPLLVEGSGRTQAIRMVLAVSSTSAVTLKIDPSVILATRKYVDDNFVNRITVRGGKAGQVLAKRSDADEDFYWLDPLLKRGSLENTDLNTLGGPQSEGVWHQAFNGNARAELNYPVQTAGVLTCAYSAYLGCQQRYESYEGDIYLRGLTADWDGKKGQWTPWIKQARADSLGSVAKENIVPLSKGGTGATTAADARKKLELGAVATEDVVPLSKGGTGATTAADARKKLELGAVATEDVVPLSKGGTGATTADDARKKLAIGRVEQRDSETIIYAGDDHTSYFAIRIDGQWGIYDPAQGFIPLGVQQGGTGARDADEARKNLKLGRIEQRAGETVIFCDDTKTAYFTARKDNQWGLYDGSKFVPLGIQQGGTGAQDAPTARFNLELGNAATGHVRTGKISLAGDKLFATPFPNACTGISFCVVVPGNKWIFSPYVTYLTRAGFGFDGRCWSGLMGTEAQPFGEEVYYIAWGN